MNFYLSPIAEYDLNEIWERIANDDIGRADNFCEKLKSAMIMLGENPMIGHLREEIRDPAIRVWSVGNYLIIYRITKRPIEIVRLISGFKDLHQIKIGD